MARPPKTLSEQIRAMARDWPAFEAVQFSPRHVTWCGPLTPLARPYMVTIDYTLVSGTARPEEPLAGIPLVRVLSPCLEQNWNVLEEAPLPHVYFDSADISRSALCLFDPAMGQWSPADLIAFTTIYWALDWLQCYEGWQATGRWFGGGRHAPRLEQAQS